MPTDSVLHHPIVDLGHKEPSKTPMTVDSRWKLDRNGAETLVDQIYRLIAEMVSTGDLRPGERLPSERILCAELDISRVTLRRALSKLAEDGLVESSAGRGSYVASTPLGEPPNALISFTDMGAQRGLAASSRVLAAEIREATLEEAEELQIAPGANVFDLQRLRLLDNVPIAISRACIPLARAPILPTVDFTEQSLYKTLEQTSGVVASRADYALQAAEADEDEADLLGLAHGQAVLVAQGVTYDQHDRPVEVARIVYRSDRYRFYATLRRPPSSARNSDSSG